MYFINVPENKESFMLDDYDDKRQCDDCCQENTVTVSVFPDEDWEGNYTEHETWQCPSCGCEHND
jgi:hypothetical protein